MKIAFSIERDQLLQAMQWVVGVLERRQTLPILSHVLLELDHDQLTITATDLELELQARAPLSEANKKSSKFTLPGRKLLDICRALPEGAMVTLSCQKDKACLQSDLSTGNSRFDLAMLPAKDFPSIKTDTEQLTPFSMSQKTLKELIRSTHFAMAQQDVRYYLNGILFEITAEGFRMVATDGHRLAMSTTAVAHEIVPKQVIVPRKGIIELARLLDSSDEQIDLSLSDHYLSIQGPTFRFTTKLIDHRFPDYQQALPKNGDKVVRIERDLLKSSLTRAAILSNEKFRGISIKIDERSMQIKANNPEQELAEEKLGLSYSGDGFEMGFNVNYLMDVLNTMGSQLVQFTFGDINSSVLIEGVEENTDSLYVVMPLRL